MQGVPWWLPAAPSPLYNIVGNQMCGPCPPARAPAGRYEMSGWSLCFHTRAGPLTLGPCSVCRVPSQAQGRSLFPSSPPCSVWRAVLSTSFRIRDDFV